MQSQSRVLIVQQRADGHRLLYVAVLARFAGAAGAHVSIMLPEAVRTTDEYALHLRDVAPDEWIWVPDHGVRAFVKATQEAARRTHADLVLVPEGDFFLMQLALRPSWGVPADLVGLVMRDPKVFATPGVAGRSRAWAKALLLARAARLNRVRILRLGGQATTSDDAWVRDPTLFAPSDALVQRLRAELDLAPGIFWYSVLGAITSRKNVPLVADALVGAACPGGTVGLVVAGPFDPAARAEAEPRLNRLRAAGVAVRVLDRVLTDGEIDALVVLSDAVVIAHSNEGPSAILAKALSAGTRFLVAGARSLQPDAAAAAGGMWVELDPESLAVGLSGLKDRPRPAPVAVPDDADFAAAFLGRSGCGS